MTGSSEAVLPKNNLNLSSEDTELSIEKTLFAAADKMRGSMDAGEYKHIALGLPFFALRYFCF